MDGGVYSTWLLPYDMYKNMDTRLIRTTANKPRDIYCITFRFGWRETDCFDISTSWTTSGRKMLR